VTNIQALVLCVNISYAARTSDDKSPSESSSKKPDKKQEAESKKNDVTDASGSEVKQEQMTQSKSSTLEGCLSQVINSLGFVDIVA